jgi:hypothetical protein
MIIGKILFQVGLAQKICFMDFKFAIYFFKKIFFGGKRKLVEFTLNIKYNKNPHENIF